MNKLLQITLFLYNILLLLLFYGVYLLLSIPAKGDAILSLLSGSGITLAIFLIILILWCDYQVVKEWRKKQK